MTLTSLKGETDMENNTAYVGNQEQEIFADTAGELPTASRCSAVKKRYEQFKEDNPWFVDECARISRIVKQSGVKRWGIKACIEVIRFNYLLGYSDTVIVDGQPRRIKINNLFAPYLAREVMLCYPDLEGFFELRVISHE